MEFLKAIFGDKAMTYEELAAALKDSKDVKLANLAKGEYVGVEKFNAKVEELKTANGTIRNLQDQVKKFDGVDVEGLKNAASELETKYKAQLTAMQKETALKLALSGKAHDPGDIIKLLDLSKIDLDDSGNLKTGIDDLVKPFRESKPYLFIEDKDPGTTPPINGAKPADPKGRTEPRTYTQEEIGKMSMAEYRAYREQLGNFPKN